jgi:hypothetical protein
MAFRSKRLTTKPTLQETINHDGFFDDELIPNRLHPNTHYLQGAAYFTYIPPEDLGVYSEEEHNAVELGLLEHNHLMGLGEGSSAEETETDEELRIWWNM